MHSLEVIGQAHAYRFPGEWKECSVAQLGTIAALTSVRPPAEARPDVQEYHEAHLRLCLLRQLTGMPDDVFGRIATEDLIGIRSDELGIAHAAFLPELDWCLAEPLWSESMLPTVVVRKATYQGPTDRLGRFSVLQWGFCDALLQNLANTGNAKDLHLLLGALYHKEGTTWSNKTIEQRADVLAQLDDRTKLAMVLNYRALRAWLAAKYWRCFKGGKADAHGVQGMIVRMAGPKFGTVEQTRHADLHDVLIHVEQSIEQDELLKQQT